MSEDERFALIGDIKEAEHRMRKARESGNRHAFRDALKWRDKSIRKLRENDNSQSTRQIHAVELFPKEKKEASRSLAEGGDDK